MVLASLDGALVEAAIRFNNVDFVFFAKLNATNLLYLFCCLLETRSRRKDAAIFQRLLATERSLLCLGDKEEEESQDSHDDAFVVCGRAGFGSFLLGLLRVAVRFGCLGPNQ